MKIKSTKLLIITEKLLQVRLKLIQILIVCIVSTIVVGCGEKASTVRCKELADEWTERMQRRVPFAVVGYFKVVLIVGDSVC